MARLGRGIRILPVIRQGAAVAEAPPPGGHVTFRAAGTAAVAASGTTTSLAPGLPAGTAENDWLVCVHTANNQAGASFSTGGWVEIGSGISTGTTTADITLRLYAKPAGASEPAPTLTLTSGRHTAQIFGWSGQDPSTPIDITPVTALTLDPSAVTPVTTNALPIAFGGARGSVNGELHNFATTTGVLRGQATMATAGGPNYGHAAVELAEWSAGAADAALTDTITNSVAVSIALAIRPAPGGAGQAIATGQTIETETAQPVGRLKASAAAQTVETETAQPVAARKALAASQALENETAQPITARKTVAVGQALETETAQPITPTGPTVIPVSQATETETAQPVTSAKTATAAQAVETETAQAVTVVTSGGFGIPQNLTATTISGSQINLDWDPVTGATGYDIERNSVVIVTDHPTDSYSDTGLDQATLYSYRVRAVKA